MRVRGDVQPSNAFTVEEQPKSRASAWCAFLKIPKSFQRSRAN